MTTKTASTVSDNGVFLFHDGKYNTVGATHPNLRQIKEAIQNKNYSRAQDLMDVSYGMNDWATKSNSQARDFVIKSGKVYLDNHAFNDAVSGKVISMMQAGQDAYALINFLRKTRQNPSAIAQNELLLFCQANNFLIHEDGDIIAFKGIRNNYYDMHSGKFDNSVGKTVVMERNKVDDRREITCSYGLHFGALEYATGFGEKVVVVKVNPKDVVSIPNDYANQKGRCAGYFVLSELEDKRPPIRKEVYSDSDFVKRDNIKRCCKCGWSLSEDDITYYINTCRICHND